MTIYRVEPNIGLCEAWSSGLARFPALPHRLAVGADGIPRPTGSSKVVVTEPQHGAGGISIHAVDIAGGVPAAGLGVRLWFLGEGRVQVAEGACSKSGLLQHPVAKGAGVERGMYEVEFDVGAYYRAQGVSLPWPSFLEVAVFRFGIDRITEHFHLPFKFTPWGFSLFRGGA